MLYGQLPGARETGTQTTGDVWVMDKTEFLRLVESQLVENKIFLNLTIRMGANGHVSTAVASDVVSALTAAWARVTAH